MIFFLPRFSIFVLILPQICTVSPKAHITDHFLKPKSILKEDIKLFFAKWIARGGGDVECRSQVVYNKFLLKDSVSTEKVNFKKQN